MTQSESENRISKEINEEGRDEGDVMEGSEDCAPEAQIWGLWGTLFLAGGIAFALMIVQGLSIVACAFYLSPDLNVNDLESIIENISMDGDVISVCTFLTMSACLLLVWIAIIIKRGSRLMDYLDLRNPSKRELRMWFIVTVGFLVFSQLMSYVIVDEQAAGFMISVYESADSKILLLLAVVIAAPVYEELFFRGFLLKGLSHSFIGKHGAVIFCSLTWAMIHVQYSASTIGMLFLLGLILGYARLKTQSLILCIALHALVNITASVQMMFAFA